MAHQSGQPAGRFLSDARRAENDHDYKYTIAAMEEIEAAHPACRPALAAAAMAFLRRDDSDDQPLRERLQSD